MEVWRLTDQEIKAVELSGGNLAVAEGAKRQAFLDNGGVILNPDALSDVYEALKKVEEDINWMLNNRKFLNPDVFDYLDKAIEKAEESK